MNYFSIRNLLLTFLLISISAAYCISIFVNGEGFGQTYNPLTINAGKYEPVIMMGLKPGRTYKVNIINKTKPFEHDPSKILLSLSEKLYKVIPISASLLQVIFPEIVVPQSPHVITFDLNNPSEADNCNYEISIIGNEQEMREIEQKQREEYYRKVDESSDMESQQMFKTMETIMKENIPLFNINMSTGNVIFGAGMKQMFKETQKLLSDNQNNVESKEDK